MAGSSSTTPCSERGWWGELAATEFARFLPDARTRFLDQPPRYFPPADGSFIPQQTFDQVAYQLGVVGIAAACWASWWRLPRRPSRPRAVTGLEATTSSRPTWRRAGLLRCRCLAGSALFGGTPIAALFWITFGLSAPSPSLPRRAFVRPKRPHERRRGATPVDRARDRTAERRWSGVARDRARSSPAANEVTTSSSSPAPWRRVKNRWSTSPDERGVPVVRLPALQRELSIGRDAGRYAELRRTVMRRHADMLHTHTAKAGAHGAYGGLACPGGLAPSDRPHLPRPRLSGYFDPRRERSSSISNAARPEDAAIVAVTDEVRDDLVELGSHRPARSQ